MTAIYLGLAVIPARRTEGRRLLATSANGDVITLSKKTLLAAVLLGAAVAAVTSPAAAGEQTTRAEYVNGLASDSSYFPIGVWLQSPKLAPEYQAIGVNLFVGLYQGPTESQLAELAKYGMPVIANQNDVALHSRNASMIRGWMLGDEPDNAQPFASGSWGRCVPAKAVTLEAGVIKAKDPTRPVLVNFGRGVADPNWRGRGLCSGDMAYYDEAAVGADILSFDIYPVASGYGGQLDYPSRGIRRLRADARDGQHVWAIIETTRIGSREARVTPAQLRSEVLLALIEGADGIVYFAHEWTGGFREDGLFRYPEIVQAVKDTNALLTRLAPVLNSATIEGRIASSGTILSTTMLKQFDGALYLFAGSMDAKAGSVSFSFSGLSTGRAEVLGEDRQVLISNGVFSDSFNGGYEVHVYRITERDRP